MARSAENGNGALSPDADDQTRPVQRTADASPAPRPAYFFDGTEL
jgi:hypothetical protein